MINATVTTRGGRQSLCDTQIKHGRLKFYWEFSFKTFQ